VPPELSAIAMKALATDPDDRYQTVLALRRDLELFLEGRSVSAKEDNKRELLAKFVRRNKGFSFATGAGALLLFVVASFFLKINYSARLRAEEEKRSAVKAKEDFEESQRQKNAAVQASLPAFVGAARQLSNDMLFLQAHRQIEVALAYDPGNAAARRLKAQLLVGQKEWTKARDELAQFVVDHPRDAEAGALLKLCRLDVKDPAVLFALATALQSQQMYGAATNLLKDVEVAIANRKPLFELYAKQLEARWRCGKSLYVMPNGDFYLNLQDQKQITDLQPLKGFMLQRLQLSNGPSISSLEPLRGMPLHDLSMGPSDVKDLEPLRGMKLASLDVRVCEEIADIEPLRGMPIVTLTYMDRKIVDLGALKGMPLETLDLSCCHRVADLRPIAGTSTLTTLVLVSCPSISDLEPLRGLTRLRSLRLDSCAVRTLEPLAKLPLRELNIGATAVGDLSPLRGMPLVDLSLLHCAKIDDLTPLEGMKLQTITFTPKHIRKGTEALRKMDSLKSVTPELTKTYPVDEFWRRYDAGEFKK